MPLTSILVSTETQSEGIEKSIDETIIIVIALSQLDKSHLFWVNPCGAGAGEGASEGHSLPIKLSDPYIL